MNKFPEPRPFQITAREKLRQGYKDNHKNQIIMAPTGGGKTILAMYIINGALEKNKRVCFIADRKTLINQTSQVADDLGLTNHGIIMSKHWRYNLNKPFQIASAQTIARRGWPEADLYVIDEVHTMLKAWTDHVNETKGAVIGLSATPFSPLGKYFTNLINAATMSELTEQGILVPLKIMSCKKINMSGAETAGGEWTDLSAEQRGLEIVGNVIEDWKKYGENRKTIVFGSTILHCERMCREFNDNGIMATLFTSETTEIERKVILDEFKKQDSELKVLISVECLAKGFDNNLVSCICDVRPLRKSLSTAIQIWGRGLRSAPGKENCLLLDFSGNIVRFSEDFEEIFYNGLDKLDDGEKLDKKIRKDENDKPDKEYVKCPKCSHSPFFRRCISCGFESPKICTIEHEKGEMIEFKIGKATIRDKLSVWEQCVSLCRQTGAYNTAKGRASHLYKSITGVFPRNLPEFHKVPDVDISQAIISKQKSNQIAFRSRQSKV